MKNVIIWIKKMIYIRSYKLKDPWYLCMITAFCFLLDGAIKFFSLTLLDSKFAITHIKYRLKNRKNNGYI